MGSAANTVLVCVTRAAWLRMNIVATHNTPVWILLAACRVRKGGGHRERESARPPARSHDAHSLCCNHDLGCTPCEARDGFSCEQPCACRVFSATPVIVVLFRDAPDE